MPRQHPDSRQGLGLLGPASANATVSGGVGPAIERRANPDQLEFIAGAARLLSGPLTVEEVADRFLAEAAGVVSSNTAVAVIEYDGTSFRTLGARGPLAERFTGRRYDIGTLPAGVRRQLLDLAKPIVLPDVVSAGGDVLELSSRFEALQGARSLAIVPLVSRDRTVAAVLAVSREPGAVSPERVALLSTLGTFFAGALHNAQLVAEATHRAETLARQAALLDLSSDAIFVRDLDGTIRFWSRGATELLGWTASEAVGQNSLHLLRPVYPRPRDVLHEELRRTGRWTGEVVYYHRDGHAIDVVLRWALREAAAGEDESVLVTATDISERKRLERMKDEFIGMVSHELRTPLTAMRGALGLLAAGVVGELPPEARSLAEIANANTERLGRLVHNILDLERLRAGKMPFVPVEVEITELVSRVVATMQPMATKAGVRLEIDASPIVVRADRDALEQLITNLVSNAVKFSPQEGVVRIAVQGRPDSVRLSVSDNGRGIPADQLERVFERFAQVDASDSRQKGGTGLGLAICRAIAEQHGARIWAESVLGAGTTFILELPREPVRP